MGCGGSGAGDGDRFAGEAHRLGVIHARLGHHTEVDAAQCVVGAATDERIDAGRATGFAFGAATPAVWSTQFVRTLTSPQQAATAFIFRTSRRKAA